MKTAIVIPARYKSTRFPGKPLIPLCGKPMILWVAEICAKALPKSAIYVATEDRRIVDVVERGGFKAILTSDMALTGTDRIAEAVESLDAELIINVQGDEPLLDPNDIIKIIEAKIEHFDEVINGFTALEPGEDPESVNIPKVIFTEDMQMVYMSRKALPGYKSVEMAPKKFFKQVCIYAFTREELKWFGGRKVKSELEAAEDIEILRFLESGKKIRMIETSSGSLAVDIPEDVPGVEEKLKKIHNM